MSKATERMLAESARFERRMLWRVAGMFHVAESREQARKNVQVRAAGVLDLLITVARFQPRAGQKSL